MGKLKKETAKRLKNGSYSTLIEVFEEAVDSYNEKAFEQGYGACLDDMIVRSQLLAEYIDKHSEAPLKVDELAKVIDDYFTNALKEE